MSHYCSIYCADNFGRPHSYPKQLKTEGPIKLCDERMRENRKYLEWISHKSGQDRQWEHWIHLCTYTHVKYGIIWWWWLKKILVSHYAFMWLVKNARHWQKIRAPNENKTEWRLERDKKLNEKKWREKWKKKKKHDKQQTLGIIVNFFFLFVSPPQCVVDI